MLLSAMDLASHGQGRKPANMAWWDSQDHCSGTAQTGITCNALCPGWVLTPLVQQQIDKRIAQGEDAESARDALLSEKQPSREFVTPQQLGELALFLCSDAAAQVRGVAWNMDGGWVAQ